MLNDTDFKEIEEKLKKGEEVLITCGSTRAFEVCDRLKHCSIYAGRLTVKTIG